MIIDKTIDFIADKFGKTKEKREDIAFGLTVGLAFGLAFGLVNFLISVIIPNPTFSFFITLGILIFILAEVLFSFDKKNPKSKESKFFFTIKRKLLGFGESTCIIGNVIGAYQLVVKGVPMLNEWLGQYGQSVLSFVGYGTLTIIILSMIIYIYIWLNSLKYRGR